MKRIRILLVTTVVFSFIIACGKKAPDPLYQPDSKEYTFFKTLAAKSEILNPDQVNELIKTSSFNIYTNDVMPIMYRQWQRYSANLNQIPNDQVSGFIYHIATREAEKRL